jgi:hypothetical protein
MSNFKEKIQLFYRDPFQVIDNLNLQTKHLNLNIFQNYRHFRNIILGVAVVSLAAWVIMGFDSTPLQIINPIMEIVLGQQATIAAKLNYGTISNWQFFWLRYNWYYGKENHWSAWVIYGFLFYFLSKHFDKIGISKSKNLCYAVTLVGLSVATFEFYWMWSFAFWQHQPWVATWAMPQLRILFQNLIFLIIGIFGAVYLFVDSFNLKDKVIVGRSYHFRWNKIAYGLLTLSIGTALLWWFYPWSIQHITVPLSDGSTWTNSNNFPQTLYTIKVNVSSPVNAGGWYYVQDNLIHGLNTLVKVLWTMTIGYVCMVVKVKKQGGE